MSLPKHCNILVIGGGVVGLTIARALRLHGVKDIVVIEKETRVGLHASGRNSGVMHAGIYYHNDSLKAKYCREGSKLMQDYCHQHGLKVLKTGKVIVAKGEQELPVLTNLHQRSKKNGANVSIIDEKTLQEVEPEAKTFKSALWSHDTAVVDPKAIMAKLFEELNGLGVTIITDCLFCGYEGKKAVKTSKGIIRFQYLINAAGSYADVVAHAFDIGKSYTLLPFKGVYQKCRPNSSVSFVKGNIYPVPDLRNPFLGVHFTRGADGDVYVGPTAIPCFGRENYKGLKGIGAEGLNILLGSFKLLMSNPGFRQVAIAEPKKYLQYFLYQDAKKLVQSLSFRDLCASPKVGIRSQLVHWPTHSLVMDFLIKEGEYSLHVLNAISPAFTCSMSMAKEIANQYLLRSSKIHES